MAAFRSVALALFVACLAAVQADNKFLATSEASEQKEKAQAEPEKAAAVIADTSMEVVEAKEIEFDASNPYPATGATAEALALLFMIVACMICYLECCK
eukprot:CAMPEP_0197651682 /NCGR_PEP_ID=MMETSP1338-20131121/33666_1 /TAXON_ID=43686 ORGANISM="Pelagodinium beii, Strain RCC1491" /NCGR_SAMPLE_ID=MMETSP1338 /ASSEMBLY_ACC=CAM_ASM_000754 /LENGTH=98 /DNA_ID=CAMNT_0043226389 /DNA_START=50 /DNA_END=346 /DNA_ORIENTATION=+